MEPLKYVALQVLRNCGGKLKYWKLVAKLATDFMSVRISMLSVFRLNKLLSVLEISFILNYPHICAFFVLVEDFVPSNSEQANFSRKYFH